MTGMIPFPLSFGPFRGTNSRLPDFALKSDEGDWLRAAENVDVDNAGRLRLRIGQTLEQALTAPHSLFRSSDGRFFMVLGGVLYRVTLPGYSQALVAALSNDGRVFYAEHNGDIYYSNGTDAGRIDVTDARFPWGLPTPALPAVATAAGTLEPGRYRVAVTYSNATTGEEGGHAGATTHALAAAGALSVTLPVAAIAGATHVNVYVSDLNGSVLRLHGAATIGTASYSITDLDTTKRLDLKHLEPLPAGTGVFYINGRLGCIVGKRVLFGEPRRLGYYDPLAGQIPFEAAVSLVVPAQNGCYIVADQTRWFEGDIGNSARVVDVLPYGGVPGTAFVTLKNDAVGWFGAFGVVLADTNGAARPLMAHAVDLSPPASGCSTAINEGGFDRVISCGWSVNLETGAATQYSNFDFSSFAGGYGTKAGGVYLLGGINDDGADIDATMDFGKLDAGVPVKKRIKWMRVGVDCAESMVVTLTTPDRPLGVSYDRNQLYPALLVQQIRPGLGLKAEWFGIRLTNQNGAGFLLASLLAEMVVLPRRV